MRLDMQRLPGARRRRRRDGSATYASSIGMAGDFEASQAFTGLDEFIRYVNLHDEHEIDVPEADVSGSDAVRFMTVHAAKGLEFPVVFLAHVKPPIIQHRGWLFFDDEMGLIIKDLGDTNKPTREARPFCRRESGRAPEGCGPSRVPPARVRRDHSSGAAVVRLGDTKEGARLGVGVL